MEITKLSWMSEEEFNNYKVVREQFQNMCCKYKDYPMMKSFSQDKAISLVFNSNKLENTLSSAVKYNDIYKLLENISLDSTNPITLWNADGNVGYSRCQLIQHLKAYYYLLSRKKLSVSCMLETHRIPMMGAVSDKGSPILNSKIQRFGVNNGVDNYMYHENVEDHL